MFKLNRFDIHQASKSHTSNITADLKKFFRFFKAKEISTTLK